MRNQPCTPRAARALRSHRLRIRAATLATICAALAALAPPEAALALGAHPKSKAAPGRHRSHRRTERPATRAQFDAINRMFKETERTLHVELEWVEVSTQGPFALAYLQGGQDTATLLRGAGTRWRGIATISDEGLRCGLVPPRIIAGLHLERYNEGPHPC